MATIPGGESHAKNLRSLKRPPRLGALLCLWALVLFFPVEAVAESVAEASATVVDTLVVRAGLLVDQVTPSVAGVVTRVNLQDETGSQDLAANLAQVAGLQIRRYGGIGFAGVPSLRGSAAAQIRVFLDGMPLNDAQSGTNDLSHLPLALFQAAEIHRGVVPVALGGIGGAGAINLITRDRLEGSEVQLFAGSYGDRGARLTWGADSPDGDRSILLMLHGRRADNDYLFTDHLQTFIESGDDSTRVRTNAAFEEFGFWGTGRWQAGQLVTRFSGSHFRKDGGRPGPLNYPSPHARVRYGRTAAHLALDFADGLVVGDVAGGRTEQFLFDPANEINDGFAGTVRSVGEDVTFRLASAPELLAGDGGAWPPQADLLMGLEHGYQTYRQWYGPNQDPRRNRKSLTAFAGLDFGFWADRGHLALAGRWQHIKDDFPPIKRFHLDEEEVGVQNESKHFSPSAGVMWQLWPKNLTLEAHASQTVRTPTWVELFGHRGGIDGNRKLRPEEIKAADVGITWQDQAGNRSLRLVGFVAATDSTIVFLQNSPATSRADNLGKTHTEGLELEIATTLPGAATLLGNATWQQARDHGDELTYVGKAIPYLSDTEIQVRLMRPVGRFAPWLEVGWQSEFYRDRSNSDLSWAPEQWEMNLGLKFQTHPAWLGPASRFEISIEAINITDNTVYDLEEFPLPGRRFHVSLRIQR